MNAIDIKQMYADPNKLKNKDITISGWVKSVRSNGTFGFIDFTDGTYFRTLQIVYAKDKVSNFDDVAKLNAGSTITVSGKFVVTPENKQPFELHATSVDVFCATDADYPLQKKRHSVEFLREIAYLRPRTNLFQAV